MKTISYLSILGILFFTSCDPVHNLHLENGSKSIIEFIYYPSLGQNHQIEQQVSQVMCRNKKMNKLRLYPGEAIPIGSVIARYTPDVEDIELEYLEVRQNEDTIRLIGKGAIFMGIQKVEKLDWRLVVR